MTITPTPAATPSTLAAHHAKHIIHMSAKAKFLHQPTRSVLAWPAWRRVLAVLPAVLLLWLAVGWANGLLDGAPW